MNRPAQPGKSAPAPSRAGIFIEFLGSMNLAITLLVAVAIASVIGTVLKQNEPYQNYIIKFGPFWHEIYRTLGLYDVYSAGWFLFILAFLVISTSVCIYRNAPDMVRDMRELRTRVRKASLQGFHHQRQWQVARPVEELVPSLMAGLHSEGYRARCEAQGDHRVIAARKGALNRLGYLFTHAAIVIICIGGLVDGNLPLKLKEMAGQIKPETRDIPASEVPKISWLPVENPSFRGNVNIPEGGTASIVFLQLRDGYLVQPLPFTIALKDFRVEHYATGQPKSFESDLVIHDPEREAPLTATIAVNHPLIYKGYAIYQASFSDGGSRLRLKAWSLNRPRVDAQDLESAVFERLQVEVGNGETMTLEFNDFRLFNINPAPEGSGRKFMNFGPSFTYKLRNAQGEAREYENYMSPVELEGRRFYLSGMRTTPSEPFFYLHVPADARDSLERFMRFNAMLRDEDRLRGIAEAATRATFAASGSPDAELNSQVVNTMLGLMDLFTRGGFEAIVAQVEESVPEDRRLDVMDAYMKVLRNLLSTAYAQVLEEEGVDISAGINERDARFYEDAVNALAALPVYGSPFYLQLTDFTHVQASGLQIARAPGKNVVYLGFALLTLGVFMMFYVHQRRLWFWLEPEGQGTRVLFAGTGSRDRRDFAAEFERLAERFARVTGGNAGTSTGPKE